VVTPTPLELVATPFDTRRKLTKAGAAVMLKLFGSSTITMGASVPLVRANFPSAFTWYSEMTGCTV
jgi:hypothetical protein